MKESPSSKVDSSSASHEIPLVLLKVLISSQINPSHTFPCYFSKICLNTVLSSVLGSLHFSPGFFRKTIHVFVFCPITHPFLLLGYSVF